MRGRVHQVVHLHQIEALHAKLPHRVLHLTDSRLLAARPDLGRDEKLGLDAERRGELAGHGFGGAVHRGAVDHAAAQLDEDLQGLLGLCFLLCIGGDVEHLPGAQADCGESFAGFRDAPRERAVRHG